MFKSSIKIYEEVWPCKIQNVSSRSPILWLSTVILNVVVFLKPICYVCWCSWSKLCFPSPKIYSRFRRFIFRAEDFFSNAMIQPLHFLLSGVYSHLQSAMFYCKFLDLENIIYFKILLPVLMNLFQDLLLLLLLLLFCFVFVLFFFLEKS